MLADILFVAGIILVSVGAGMVYLPAGIIVAGLCCGVMAIMVRK